MMAVALPDWGAAWRPAEAAAAGAYRGFEAASALLVLPDRLTIARDADGPAFSLTGVRPTIPSPANPAYSHLQFRLEAAPPDRPADAPSWTMVRIAGGFLRFKAGAGLGLAGPELAGPFALDWSALGATPFSLKLSPEAASIIESALTRDALPLTAIAEIEIEGVSPRLPARVRLRMRDAMAALRRVAASGRGVLARASLGQHLLSDGAAALKIDGVDARDPVVRQALVDALGDRLRVRFARPTPSPFDDGTPSVALPADDADVPDDLVWDLAQMQTAPRALAIGIDPFAEARRLLGAAPIDKLIRRIATPPLSLGHHRVAIASNAPPRAAGAEMLGFRLRFPPRPPGRPHEIDKMLDVARSPVSHVDVRLAPGEPLAWTGRGVLAVRSGRGVERLEGEETPGQGGFAFAGMDAFPARFLECRASAGLLAVGTVAIAIEAERPTGPFRATLSLDGASPVGHIVLPRDAAEARLLIAVTGPDGARIALAPRPAEDAALDLVDLAGYGARHASLTVTFDDGRVLAAIDVAPEPEPDRIETISFTPRAPSRDYRWFARDPFRPGFRWRWRARADEAEFPWSAPVREDSLTLSSRSRGGGL